MVPAALRREARLAVRRNTVPKTGLLPQEAAVGVGLLHRLPVICPTTSDEHDVSSAPAGDYRLPGVQGSRCPARDKENPVRRIVSTAEAMLAGKPGSAGDGTLRDHRTAVRSWSLCRPIHRPGSRRALELSPRRACATGRRRRHRAPRICIRASVRRAHRS